MNERTVNVYIGSPGGNSSKNSKYYHMAIPPVWAKSIGITPEDRRISLSFDGETITIHKAVSEDK